MAVSNLEDLAKQTKALEEIITNVENIVKKFARSVTIEVNNVTSRTLRRRPDNDSHGHGAFGKLPAETINPGQNDVFASRSAEGGIMVGTTGRVFYELDAEGTKAHVSWIVPFVGENESHIS